MQAAGGLSLDDGKLHELSSVWNVSIHLAVMRQPYLDYVIDGSKTVESRLTKNRIVPYRAAGPGDIILFKESGGPISAVAVVRNARFFEIKDAAELGEVVDPYLPGLAYDDDFLPSKAEARFVSLITIDSVAPLAALRMEKQSRQSWVTYRPGFPAAGLTPESAGRQFAILMSGSLGGGKSSAGQVVATKLGLPRLSFGSLVRDTAARRGLEPDDRAALQELGEQMLVSLGPDGLVDQLVGDIDGGAVIEGVRHITVLDALLSRYPQTVHVHLVASADELERRWGRRFETLSLREANAHSTEVDQKALRSRAHLVVDTTARTPEQVGSTVVAYIS